MKPRVWTHSCRINNLTHALAKDIVIVIHLAPWFLGSSLKEPPKYCPWCGAITSSHESPRVVYSSCVFLGEPHEASAMEPWILLEVAMDGELAVGSLCGGDKRLCWQEHLRQQQRQQERRNRENTAFNASLVFFPNITKSHLPLSVSRSFWGEERPRFLGFLQTRIAFITEVRLE